MWTKTPAALVKRPADQLSFREAVGNLTDLFITLAAIGAGVAVAAAIAGVVWSGVHFFLN